MPQVIERATMRERVDHQRAVGPAQHLGLAATVVEALQGVGQRLADEHVGRGEDRPDGRHLEIVEVQLDVGEQDAPMSCGYLSPGGRLGHIGACNLLDQRSIVLFANLGSGATEVLGAGRFRFPDEVLFVFG